MAQLKDSLVTGSLRVTDTIYTTDLLVSGSKTAKYVLAAPNAAAGAPTWRALVNSDVGLGNVENTKLSTWVGTSNITTVGTISSGTWQGTSVKVGYGGTGTTTAPTQGGIIFGSSTTAYGCTAAGTSGQLLQSAGTSTPTWITATNSNTASTIVKRDASGNFSAGTITASLSGNASTATRIDGNVTTCSDANNHNIWFSSDSSGSGIPNIAAGVYITPSTKTITATTLAATQLFVRHSSWVKGTQIASDASLTINFVEKGTGTADANKLGMIKSYACGGTKNTRIGLWAYKNELSDTGADYFLLAYEWDGTTAVKRTYTDAKVYGAVWNDYAEFRKTNEKVKPGQVVVDNDDGSLNIAYARLLPGAQVVSDTFGFAIGETEKTKTPLAVSGRVLVYTYQDRNKYHAGQAVCSAPNGTIDIMTRREIEAYPDAIIGIVSEIPNYEEWGQDNIKVDNRIWIKVR